MSTAEPRLRDAIRASPPLLWSAAYFFFLLTGYYVLRPVRDAMGASADVEAVFSPATIAWFAARDIAIGDFTLQALFTGTFVAMLLLQPVYGCAGEPFSAAGVPARACTRCSSPACSASTSPSWARARDAARLFFVWTAVFNLFAVSVFWSFMADIFSDVEARRAVWLHRCRRHAGRR